MTEDMVTNATNSEKCQLARMERGIYWNRPMTKLGLNVMLNESLRWKVISGPKTAERGRFAFKRRGVLPK